MTVVCPQDVKKMLLGQARMVYWKKWAKFECEELKEGVWLKPIQTVLRLKTKRSVDRQAPTCDVEIGRGSRIGAE